MFIKSVSSGGGYQGDVNHAYRLGRQLAFNDQIDAYNKALQADANAYNFNQAVVKDTAGNYGLQVGMNDKARADAFNFATKSNEIANAEMAYRIGQEKRDALEPFVEQVGTDQAKKFVFGTATDANNANYNNAVSTAKVDNVATTTDTYAQDQQNKLRQAQIAAEANHAKQDVVFWTDPNNQEAQYKIFLEKGLASKRESDKRNGIDRSDAERLQELKSDPELFNEFVTYSQSQANNVYSALQNGAVNATKTTRASEPKVEEPTVSVGDPVPKSNQKELDAAFNIPLGNGYYTDKNRSTVYYKTKGENGTITLHKVKFNKAWLDRQSVQETNTADPGLNF